jgi:nucleoside-diphosphate-sugar epimerase
MATTLIVGGSGFVSGAVARGALARGDEVYAVTRGKRERAEGSGIHWIVGDRKELGAAVDQVPGAVDLVVDCIAFNGEDARRDVEVFFPEKGRARAGHLVVMSSDFACSAIDRPFFIDESYDRFDTAPYGGGKREAEVVLMGAAKERRLPITVLRPCHLYGPGSLLGCLPLHGRDKELLERIGRGEALRLIGGGHFLQHPLYVEDLVDVALACAGNGRTGGEIYFVAGPEIVESRRFYQIVGEILGKEVTIEEVSIEGYLKEQPEHRAFCCHRLYRMNKLKGDGLPVPGTGLRVGLGRHVRWLRGVDG